MNYIRKYKEKDLMQINCRDDAWGAISSILAVSSWAWTFCDDKGPWAICGALKRWEGCASAWMQVDTRVCGMAKKVFMTKTCKGLLQKYCDEKGIDRLDCLVDDRYKNYDRWAEYIGFRHEYTMKLASPNCETDVHGFVYWRKK